MTHEEYMELLYPAVDRVARMFVEFEKKHGEGIKFSKDDLPACAGHAISGLRGKRNPDGYTHAEAAAARALKAVLLEIQCI
jgi:hypothetical protein